MPRWSVMAVTLLTVNGLVGAFDPPEVRSGPVTVKIRGPSVIGQRDLPVPMAAILTNSGSQPLTVRLRVQLIDGWKLTVPPEPVVAVPSGETREVPFVVLPSQDSYRAHYPVHLFAQWEEQGRSQTAHCVLVTEFQGEPLRPMLTDRVLRLPEGGELALWKTRTHQVEFQTATGEVRQMPVGWWGIEQESGTHVAPTVIDRGGRLPSIAVHPPWRKGPGSVFLRWRIALPTSYPLTLSFFLAIRDHDPEREPPSDGVTVRVWVTDGEKGEEWVRLTEHHSDSKRWVRLTADLSPFAGRTVDLTIEVHPGPRNDTTCDLAFLGNPTIFNPPPGTPVASRIVPTGRRSYKPIDPNLIVLMARKALDWQVITGTDAVQVERSLQRLERARGKEKEPIFKGVSSVLKKIRIPERMRRTVLATVGSRTVWVVCCDGELFAFAVRPPQLNDLQPGLVFLFPDGRSVETTVVFSVNVPSAAPATVGWSVKEVTNRRVGDQLVSIYNLIGGASAARLKVTTAVQDGVLKMSWEVKPLSGPDKPLLSGICLDRWSEPVERVFLGHGNVLIRPQTFILPADGHMMAARHFGLEFENRMALVAGVTTPPDYYEHRPPDHSSIHTHCETTWIFSVSRRSVWDALKRYRSADPYPAAPGVSRLAGRFVLDLWLGDPYRRVAEELKKTFAYGCTDSLIIYHVWQRFGYDYRLPDIFPPDPRYGSLEDFQFLSQTCRKNQVLFAPHDNYIDFYPDAEGFTYDRICFTEDGEPVRAWFNAWRQAQSYRWRPDSFQPFMERNLRLIRSTIGPTAYFVDVFSSIGPFDWWTKDGSFHTYLETRDQWGRAFQWIRDFLNGAPQTSESGCDWLIGWLDGATANHLRVDPKVSGIWSVWAIGCDDAERIPWFDFAHRHRFVLHGAGYSERYQGGLPFADHGIYSDDYITTEVLTGHPPMVRDAFSPQVIRKYWLLSDLMKALALVPIRSVEFADGDIHRQVITYENGATVFVNRSASDWSVKGHVLPPYGFYAEMPEKGKSRLPSISVLRPKFVRAAIERLATVDGQTVIVEWSQSDRFVYFNGRAPFRESFSLKSAEADLLSDGTIRITLNWEAYQPTSVPYRVFVHFLSTLPPAPSVEPEKILFQADHDPTLPTTQWQGSVMTQGLTRIPDELRQNRYRVLVGLYSTRDFHRAPVTGGDDQRRVFIGDLIVERKNGQVVAVRLEPPARSPTRWNAGESPVSFPWATTAGGFRYDRQTNTLLVLPGQGGQKVTLNVPALVGKAATATALSRLTEDGKVFPMESFAPTSQVTIVPAADSFGYRLTIRRRR